MSYPKWKHHAKHGAKLVQSEEHLESLGEGWGDDSLAWRPHLARPDEHVPEAKDPDDVQVPSEPAKPKPARKPQAKA